MAGPPSRFDSFDGIDYLIASGHLAEDTVADPVLGVCFVEEEVVFGIDKELAGSAIRYARPGHGDGILDVAQAVGRFVFDRRSGRFLLHIRGETAPLNHEAFDNAMEDGAVVVSISSILQKILDCGRSRCAVEFQRDIPMGRFQNNRHDAVLSEEKREMEILRWLPKFTILEVV